MKTLSIDEKDIVFSEELLAYNEFRKKYRLEARRASNDFKKKFSVRFESMDELIRSCPDIAKNYLSAAVDLALRDALQYDINDISDENFIEVYVAPHISWPEDFSEIEDKYLKIILEDEKYEEYKKTREQNSGPGVIGGGFGVEGIVGGVVIASAANLVLSTVGAIFRSQADSSHSFLHNHIKEQLFLDPDTKSHLVAAIGNMVFAVHYAAVDLINEKSSDNIFEPPTKESLDRSHAIVNNVEKGRVPKDKIRSLLIEALTLDPYNQRAYTAWSKKLGDSETSLSAFINTFSNLPDEGKPALEEAEPADESRKRVRPPQGNGWSEPKIYPKDGISDSEFVFDGETYNSQEEWDEVRIEYVEKFLASGKDTSDGKILELMKITGEVQEGSIAGYSIGCLSMIIAILVMIFHSPWWHGLIGLIAATGLLALVHESSEKKALRQWLESKKTEKRAQLNK